MFWVIGKKKERRTHLSRNRSAAGVRYRAALGAGVCLCTIKVQVPRPVCVVVPPTALELCEGKREGERKHKFIFRNARLALDRVSCQSGLLTWENPGLTQCTCVCIWKRKCPAGRDSPTQELCVSNVASRAEKTLG